MKEREHWELADTFSEMMYTLLEADYREGRLDLDSEMRRLKDLSAYSLTHAEIMVQREGVELLALAKFFGLTSESRFHKNRERLNGVCHRSPKASRSGKRLSRRSGSPGRLERARVSVATASPSGRNPLPLV